ncbi:hypothetical protein PTSG_12651 [Salpingoeca rosetta]|uniref:NADH dehydrogenase [ubiquinone] 1 alpha subcomplex subunit 7 n=1 Tax=Salpingoeca rosetta (strain ATCC 50818 / BSB-021) TaxID=946362 RepID=F2UGK8_SALR5|nr:uncharacterized protein PTSG_12651 [Salpingoeca rosetta]EGD75758.1 hypothetical protein PTSG_12651 [Salpingoeca rosetta]|eukprot:XP_004991679.1 hypothetical protein PTSG_12651 [Salpingoeca rosetta]
MSNPISKAFWRLVVREKAAQPSWLRFPKDAQTRSPPPPNLPGGPAHKISNNAYYTRDIRRQPKRVMRIGNTKHTPLFPEQKATEAIEAGSK